MLFHPVPRLWFLLPAVARDRNCFILCSDVPRQIPRSQPAVIVRKGAGYIGIQSIKISQLIVAKLNSSTAPCCSYQIIIQPILSTARTITNSGPGKGRICMSDRTNNTPVSVRCSVFHLLFSIIRKWPGNGKATCRAARPHDSELDNVFLFSPS